jgi:cobalt/nickel transport system permease protein
MHLADGVFLATDTGKLLLGGGAAAAGAGVAVGLRRLRDEDLPRTALLASAFFVVSLLRVGVGPASVHPLLLGLLGMMLGWVALPALLIGLLLQAVLFQHGGIYTLGLNLCTLGGGALLAGLLARLWLPPRGTPLPRRRAWLVGFAAGAGADLAAALLAAGALTLVGTAFGDVARLLLLAHLPVAAVEGLVCASAADFLLQVRPEAIHGLRPLPLEA